MQRNRRNQGVVTPTSQRPPRISKQRILAARQGRPALALYKKCPVGAKPDTFFAYCLRRPLLLRLTRGLTPALDPRQMTSSLGTRFPISNLEFPTALAACPTD